MNKNIAELYEAVVCFIDCNFCGNEFSSMDPHETAEEAHEEGWRVTKSGNVICPTCSAKRKRKSAPKKTKR